jgi:hypothetical protein
MKTADAASLIRQAFFAILNREPSRFELELALAQTHLESAWGSGWRGECEGSKNMGAVHATKEWQGPTCRNVDATPSGQYVTPFRVYDSELEGFKDYIRKAFKDRPTVIKAAETRSLSAVVKALYETRYFTGNRCLKKDGSGKCLVIDHHANRRDYQQSLSARLNGGSPGLPSIRRDLDAAGYGPAREAPSFPVTPVLLFCAVTAGTIVALRLAAGKR